MVDKKLDENIGQFCSVTGASYVKSSSALAIVADRYWSISLIRTRDARKFLEAHKRLDIAIDAYYDNPHAFSTPGRRKGDSSAPSSHKLQQLFEKYKG